MRFFPAEDVDAALDFPSLIESLSQAMRGGSVAPRRHHYEIERAGEAPATQLLMPAWTESGSAAGDHMEPRSSMCSRGIRSGRGRPRQSGRTGEALAAIDGTRLTVWRTAATSALAARYRARPDATRL
jgi:ornithine cyclodeaminase/alanine dehydrogenase-like protein (mu-crystallin family)